MRIPLSAVLFTTFLLFSSNANGRTSGASCTLHTGNDRSQIAEGYLVSRESSGKSVFVVLLPWKYCIEHDSDLFVEADKLRIYSSNEAINRTIEKFVGRIVRVQGLPFRARKVDQTPIVMDISKIEIIDAAGTINATPDNARDSPTTLEKNKWEFGIGSDGPKFGHITGNSPEFDFFFLCDPKTRKIFAVFDVGDERPKSGQGKVTLTAGELSATLTGPVADEQYDGVFWLNAPITRDHIVFAVLSAAKPISLHGKHSFELTKKGLQSALSRFLAACR
jgi:hypothetical protein